MISVKLEIENNVQFQEQHVSDRCLSPPNFLQLLLVEIDRMTQ